MLHSTNSSRSLLGRKTLEGLPPTSSVVYGHIMRSFFVIRNALKLLDKEHQFAEPRRLFIRMGESEWDTNSQETLVRCPLTYWYCANVAKSVTRSNAKVSQTMSLVLSFVTEKRGSQVCSLTNRFGVYLNDPWNKIITDLFGENLVQNITVMPWDVELRGFISWKAKYFSVDDILLYFFQELFHYTKFHFI